MQKTTVLFWVFIGIFSITAIITLLGITGVLKNIKEGYLKVLFTSLIIEVVAAVLVLFNSTDILNSNEGKVNFSGLIQQAGFKESIKDTDAKIFILDKLKAHKNLKIKSKKVDSLTVLLRKLKLEISNYKTEITQLNKSFYTKASRLKGLLNEFDGFINIAYNPKDKKEVYEVLAEIFNALQKVESAEELQLEDGTLNNTVIRKMYSNFKRGYIALEEEKEAQYFYIFQSDIVQMIQAYLNIIKE